MKLFVVLLNVFGLVLASEKAGEDAISQKISHLPDNDMGNAMVSDGDAHEKLDTLNPTNGQLSMSVLGENLKLPALRTIPYYPFLERFRGVSFPDFTSAFKFIFSGLLDFHRRNDTHLKCDSFDFENSIERILFEKLLTYYAALGREKGPVTTKVSTDDASRFLHRQFLKYLVVKGRINDFIVFQDATGHHLLVRWRSASKLFLQKLQEAVSKYPSLFPRICTPHITYEGFYIGLSVDAISAEDIIARFPSSRPKELINFLAEADKQFLDRPEVRAKLLGIYHVLKAQNRADICLDELLHLRDLIPSSSSTEGELEVDTENCSQNVFLGTALKAGKAAEFFSLYARRTNSEYIVSPDVWMAKNPVLLMNYMLENRDDEACRGFVFSCKEWKSEHSDFLIQFFGFQSLDELIKDAPVEVFNLSKKIIASNGTVRHFAYFFERADFNAMTEIFYTFLARSQHSQKDFYNILRYLLSQQNNIRVPYIRPLFVQQHSYAPDRIIFLLKNPTLLSDFLASSVFKEGYLRLNEEEIKSLLDNDGHVQLILNNRAAFKELSGPALALEATELTPKQLANWSKVSGKSIADYCRVKIKSVFKEQRNILQIWPLFFRALPLLRMWSDYDTVEIRALIGRCRRDIPKLIQVANLQNTEHFMSVLPYFDNNTSYLMHQVLHLFVHEDFRPKKRARGSLLD